MEYLFIQNRHLTGEQTSPQTREEVKEINGGMPLLTNLCMAMQDRRKARGPDRGLFEVLELESPGETNQKSFEKTDLVKGY